MGHTVIEHFVGRLPQVREIYDTLIAATNEFGPVVEAHDVFVAELVQEDPVLDHLHRHADQCQRVLLGFDLGSTTASFCASTPPGERKDMISPGEWPGHL